MGLFIGNSGNTVTLSADTGNFQVTNAYASITPELSFDRQNSQLRMVVRFNKTKQDKIDGKRGFNPDEIGSVQSFPCTVAELDAQTGQPLFTVAYAKLKAKFEEIYGAGKIYDDI